MSPDEGCKPQFIVLQESALLSHGRDVKQPDRT
jgi:hypothetical protein